MAKAPKNGKRQPKSKAATPTAAVFLAEADRGTPDGGSATVFDVMVAFEPEEGDAPVGMLTDAQLGNRIRLICGRGYGAFVFPHAGQVYLRVIRPD